ncbi:MAG: tRNA lysidine(34) synthetase TilS [Acidimicrobiia bacterium]
MARAGGLNLLSGRHCVVALSGGADSAVAALEATRRAPAVRAVHVHHDYPASDRLADAARAVADRLGIDLDVVAVQPDDESETAARAARRPALLAALGPGEHLVTGHTADDLAETVLQRIIRGTGPGGLAAMRPEDDRVLRPLLQRRRAEVRAEAERAGLPFVDDPANDDPRHLRTRLRRDILPALAAENPGIVDALVRLAAHAGEPDHGIPIRLGAGVARLPLPLLAVIDRARRAAAIRSAVSSIRPPHPPTTDEVDRVLAVTEGLARRTELDGGLLVLRDRTWLRIGPAPNPPDPTRIDQLPLRWGGFRFERAMPAGSLSTATVAAGSVLRGADPEDRIAIVGGHKPVGDALAEVGVPVELRTAWPVVEEGGRIVWLPLARRAAGPAPRSGRYLGVHATDEEGW